MGKLNTFKKAGSGPWLNIVNKKVTDKKVIKKLNLALSIATNDLHKSNDVKKSDLVVAKVMLTGDVASVSIIVDAKKGTLSGNLKVSLIVEKKKEEPKKEETPKKEESEKEGKDKK